MTDDIPQLEWKERQHLSHSRPTSTVWGNSREEALRPRENAASTLCWCWPVFSNPTSSERRLVAEGHVSLGRSPFCTGQLTVYAAGGVAGSRLCPPAAKRKSVHPVLAEVSKFLLKVDGQTRLQFEPASEEETGCQSRTQAPPEP